MSTARHIVIASLAAGFLVMIAIVDVQRTRAELSPTLLATLKSGTVTSVGPTSIEISGVSYRVKANAEILDHKGVPVELAKVFLRSEAKFHLNKDSEIDTLVVRRPQ
jgi:hypothetical protein